MSTNKTDIQKQLFALADAEYATFQAKLTPGIPFERFIGVRVPVLRKFARQFIKNPESKMFLLSLPHEYFDENMLHGILISEIRDYASCMELTDAFLPYVDNWAVCDTMSPKIFAKNKESLMKKICEWSKSHHTYTCRFGLKMLMNHYLDADFRTEYLQIPISYPPNQDKEAEQDYYIKMMVAWFFATSLAKQWESTIPIIEKKILPPWTHNKTIQKACESFCITSEQKKYLRTLRV